MRLPVGVSRLIFMLAGAIAATPIAAQHEQLGKDVFAEASQCIACHSNIDSDTGGDVSIGHSWRASIMANAGRDPYWLAAVRREVMDHPQAQEAIEDECATCHIPMARFVARANGQLGKIFEHYQAEPTDPGLAALAKDGVTCTVCHQITPEGLGEPSSFTGGFDIDTSVPAGDRKIYGPHEVDAGRSHVMNSASAFVPARSDHLASSEVCATCHTLYTHALDDQGKEVGEFPEQMPFLEWKHSAYRETESCQDCHMPVLTRETPITSVLGEPRPAFNQHVFRGGNVFMLRLLNTHRDELGVEALPAELEATARRTEEFLQTRTARLEIESATRDGDSIEVGLRIENLAGHKLPTAYPSRRAWLHITVTDAVGRIVFESGSPNADGSIVGNDNDADGTRFEPHYEVIESPDQVQIYEPIMVDWAGRVTTGLMYGADYAKDNRILPDGFDKHTVPGDVAVKGAAVEDGNFIGGSDRIVYRFTAPDTDKRLTVVARLHYQSIGFRWAHNLEAYASAEEPRRFVRYYRGSAGRSAVTLATVRREIEGGQP